MTIFSTARISGLDSVAGGLDYRRRPRRAPNIDRYGYREFAWSNVVTSAQPTFAGVARPEVVACAGVHKYGVRRM